MAKGRSESTLSLDLERNMNQFCRIQTYDELIRYQKWVDKQDDIERKKMEGLLIEKKSMDSHFIKKMDVVDLLNLSELKKEIAKFQESYERRLKNVMDIRKHLENEDDKVRERLLSHTDKCQKRLREENDRIEQSLILENIGKKKLASVNTY